MAMKSKYFSSNIEPINERILAYLNQLEPPEDIPLPGTNTHWLNPLKSPQTVQCLRSFYEKFYSDTNERILILGINPGRFGGGTTGVPFTDPGRLKTICNIEMNCSTKSELSSQFFYDHLFQHYPMEDFYRKYFIGAVCPLGLEKNGRNMNYYDDKSLLNNLLQHYIPDNLDKQIEIGCSKKVAICLGEGTNYSILNRLNQQNQLFDKIIKVSHPRYIMQYKRQAINTYIEQYLNACQLAERLVSDMN